MVGLWGRLCSPNSLWAAVGSKLDHGVLACGRPGQLHVHVHDKQAKAKIYTNCLASVSEHACTCVKGKDIHPGQLSLFSKKKLPWVGFKPTTVRVLGKRFTN